MADLPIVDVFITGNPQTATVEGFGTGLALVKNATDPGIIVVNGLGDVSSAGYAVKSPGYLLAEAFFAQSPRPSRLKIAGLNSAVPWTARITSTSVPATGTVVNLSVVLPNGTVRTATYTVAAGNTSVNIAAGLGASLALFAEFSVTIAAGQPYFDFQAAGGATTKFQVTGFHSSLAYLDTEADSGYATRLSDIALVDPDFYGVMTDSTSQANVAAVAAWVAANKRIHFALTQDTREANTVGGGPLAIALRDASMERGELRFSGAGARADAAMAGVILAASWDQGTAPTWAFRNLRNVPVDPLTPTQISNLQTAVHASIYVRNRGANITWEGKAPNGTFVDLRVFLDWLDARIGESVYNLLLREPRLGYTTEGIGKAGDAVWDVIRTALARKGISPDFPITFTLPKPGDATVDERSARILGGGGIRFGFVFAGAIHRVQVNGVVSL